MRKVKTFPPKIYKNFNIRNRFGNLSYPITHIIIQPPAVKGRCREIAWLCECLRSPFLPSLLPARAAVPSSSSLRSSVRLISGAPGSAPCPALWASW